MLGDSAIQWGSQLSEGPVSWSCVDQSQDRKGTRCCCHQTDGPNGPCSLWRKKQLMRKRAKDHSGTLTYVSEPRRLLLLCSLTHSYEMCILVLGKVTNKHKNLLNKKNKMESLFPGKPSVDRWIAVNCVLPWHCVETKIVLRLRLKRNWLQNWKQIDLHLSFK